MLTPKIEAFLKLIWTQQHYTNVKLVTQTGESVEITAHGQTNPDEAGIEILDAQIKIGCTTWNGPIAIHAKSSDWRKHLHHLDMAYDECILNLVLEDDAVICRINGTVIPAIRLEYPEELKETYLQLTRGEDNPLCGKALCEMKSINRYHLLTRLMIERLERKYNDFLTIYNACENNWNEVFFIMLFRSMGGDKNREAYMTLARKVSYSNLCRIKESRMAVEALLLGSAGWLNMEQADRFADEYTIRMQEEFKHLSNRFGITPMRPEDWLITKNNPHNHPVIRIAELAGLLSTQEFLFSRLLSCTRAQEMRHILQAETSEYWSTHFLPSKPTYYHSVKRIGAATIDRLCINLVAPMMFTYGKISNNEALQERALEILETIAPERNRYIISWEQKGISVENAFFSQALLQLSREYCEKKRCATCDIGKNILCSQ